jgi:hypothetical protein
MTSPETEYAIVAAGRNVLIHTGALIQGGFETPAEAQRFILDFGIRRCQIVALVQSNGTVIRRWLDGYEQAEINKALRLGDTPDE